MKSNNFNHQFSAINYPTTSTEILAYLKNIPKTERKLYEVIFIGLEKIMKNNETILLIEVVSTSLEKTGFIVLSNIQIYLLILKNGSYGKVKVEFIKYYRIIEVDFDILPVDFGASVINEGVITIKYQGTFGLKCRTIRNIPPGRVNEIIKVINMQVI